MLNTDAYVAIFIALSIPFAVVCFGLYKVTRKEKLIKRDYLLAFIVTIFGEAVILLTWGWMDNNTTVKIGSLRYLLAIYMLFQFYVTGLLTSAFMRNFSK